MNPSLKKLCEIAQKPSRIIIGLMSGTSLDGLDIAVCRIVGHSYHTQVSLLHFDTVPYPETLKELIRQVFARPTINFELLTVLNAQIARIHSEYILSALQSWSLNHADVDLIASHGQTVYHAPQRQHTRPNFPNATLQIGDGDHLAVLTGIITISDFRQKHIAAGGEGAPLALYGDLLLFTASDEDRVMINLGGIANFTWLPKMGHASRALVTDTGPGNTLIDAAMRRYYDRPFDKNGEVAASGEVDEHLLSLLLNQSYFQAPLPKTTGPEVFNLEYLDRQLLLLPYPLKHQNIIATLTNLTAVSLTECIKTNLPLWKDTAYYISGGGAENPELLRQIKMLLPDCHINKIEQLGIPSGAKEAILFAVLANETVAGGVTDFSPNPSVSTGKISLPT